MTRRFPTLFFLLAALICGPVLASEAPKPVPHPHPAPKASSSPAPAYSRMKWREVGPAISGGRVAAVVGTESDPNLYYLGSAGGGVWKTENGGATWQAVFENEAVAAIGAVAIDPKNSKTVWVGTGEANPRNDVSYGDGIYKSTDAGATWKNLGLAATRQISRILIDPRNPNLIVVGALGDVFRDSTDRGVYRSEDGGKSWKQTLYVGPQSGVSDMVMDPKDPSVLYAGIWQFRREPWTFHSGGNDDGLYKSTDGGKSWIKLAGHGLPAGEIGRIGLALAPSDPRRVYATIEAKGGILWRTDDSGANWKMVSSDTLVNQRPFYFSHLLVDPSNKNHVYAISEALAESKDGGKKFTAIAPQVHVDYHAMWIAPNNPKRMMVGEDGGYALTVDAGKSWSFSRNIPIGEVYHVGLSQNENPYTLCGGFQDNFGWCIPSNSLDPAGILSRHVIQVNGGDGEWAVPDPADPRYIWSDSENGALTILDKKTDDGWYVQPYLPDSKESYDLSKSKYRFNWDSPIAFAPWDPRVAWYGANVIFQSTDRGIHWETISPDLTLNNKAHQQPSGGPITHDVSGAESSDTILDIEGSKLATGEIWAGTDDGLIQVTRDDGVHWSNVTPKDVPAYGRVETIAPSPLQDGTAYAVFDRHRSGDYKPYAFVTQDFGKSWASIVGNLPDSIFVRTIRPDIYTKNMLYLGNEQGLYLSYDGGQHWKNFKLNLPTVSVRDIRMQNAFDDIVIATHGRAMYILDDARPLQELAAAKAQGSMLFKSPIAYEYTQQSNDEGIYTRYAGANPPTGAIIDFYQAKPQKTSPVIDILDSSGKIVRKISGKHNVGKGKKKKSVPYITNEGGLNRYVWDFSTDGPVRWMGAARERYQGPKTGPGVPPGDYTARMTLGGHSYSDAIVVKADPRTQITQAQLVESYNFSKKYFHKFSIVDTMLNTLDAVKKQLASKKKDAALASQVASAQHGREAIFNELTADYHNDEDSIQRPGALREDIRYLGYAGGGVITAAIVEFGDRVDVRYEAAIARFNAYLKTLDPLKLKGIESITGG